MKSKDQLKILTLLGQFLSYLQMPRLLWKAYEQSYWLEHGKFAVPDVWASKSTHHYVPQVTTA